MANSFLETLKLNREAGEEHCRRFWEAWHLAQTVGHPDYFSRPEDTERDKHYDRWGYCDNPSRGY